MSRKKTRRFEELQYLPNVVDSRDLGQGGDWVKTRFRIDRPLILELGCGKGEYTLALAQGCPDRNIIGIDRKGDRIWVGAKKALAGSLGNVAFLRARIEELADLFNPGQVEEIWMPYPDPLPKRRQAKHRVLSVPFLEIYRSLLRKGGTIHVKTDDEGLIQFVVQTLLEHGRAVVERLTYDLYSVDPEDDLLSVETTYERRHLDAGKTIKYVSFRFE